MNFLIVSNAPIITKQDELFAYGPYVREMEIWARYSDKVAFCCPEWEHEQGLFVAKIPFQVHKKFWLSDFNIASIAAIFATLIRLPVNFVIILSAMIWADHIHLRCPGNVGLLASIAQIFFPLKPKTAKYAGNWDSKSKQPWSYRFQKWILSNTFLTKNMQVLVYGEWPNQSKNIKPFFTATYSEHETLAVDAKKLEGISFMFVGTLSEGKRPLYAIQLIEKLIEKGFSVTLNLYGEGSERKLLEEYIAEKSLTASVKLFGNKLTEEVKQAYQNNHFLLLPSKSEGWPKVVAEAMFWGCVPVVTPVSCVPNMLAGGERGLLLSMDVENDVSQVMQYISSKELYNETRSKGMIWSRQYTLEAFESEIKKLIKES